MKRTLILFLLSFILVFFAAGIKYAEAQNLQGINILYPDRSSNLTAEFIPVYNTSCRIPILMYHSISYEKGNNLRIPRDKFYQEMKYLKDNGFNALSFDDLYEIFSGYERAPKKPVVITFDDGYRDNYLNAYPVLKELGLKATIFVITDCIDKNKSYLSSSEIIEMINNGINVESHTASHVELSALDYRSQFENMKKSREKLECIEKKEIKYISYPVGKYNKYTEKAAREAGYIMAVTTRPGYASKANGFFFLHRIRIINDQSLSDFKNILKV